MSIEKHIKTKKHKPIRYIIPTRYYDKIQLEMKFLEGVELE